MTSNLLVKVSEPLKAAIEKAASARDQYMAEWAREVLARACGYNLSAEDALEGRGRPRKYATEAERKKARAVAQARRASQERAIVEAVMRQNRLTDRAALEAWLTARGIPIDDEEVAESA